MESDRFAWPRDLVDVPPLLALCFENEEAAKAIFQSWKKKLGATDEADELRVSLLTGIDKRDPFSYRVVIGTDVDLQRGKSTRISTVARVNQMYPKSSRNLGSFLERFNRFRRYIIAPGRYISESDAPVFFPSLE